MKKLASITSVILLTLLGTSAFGQSPRKVLLEKFTSAGCPGCAWGGFLLDSLANDDPDLIPVSIHIDDQWHADEMATPDGDDVLSTYWWAQPTAMLDRYQFSDQNQMAISTVFWKDKIAERKMTPYPIELGATTIYDAATRMLTIDLNGVVQSNLSGDLRVNAYVVQNHVTGSGLGYDQLNGYNNQPGHPLQGLGNPILNYVHRFVLRDMADGAWGTAGILPDPANSGTTFSHSYSMAIDSSWDDQDLSIVVLAQRYNTDIQQREILSAISLEPNSSVLLSQADEQITSSQLSLYPQPMRDYIFAGTNSGTIDQLEIYDLQGQLVRKISVESAVTRIERGTLLPGVYLVRAGRNDQTIAVKRMFVR